MKKLLFIQAFLILLTQSCSNKKSTSNPIISEPATHPKTDTLLHGNNVYEKEQRQLARINKLCKKLALYNIEKDTQNFELRIWRIPSMWDPSILYILKSEDTTWTLFHYQYFIHHTPGISDDNNPIIDSVAMESLRPQKISWANYISSLKLDSLWNLETESSIKGKRFAMLDGTCYLLELRNKGRYKYLYYTDPDYFQEIDINHRKFAEFQDRLINPVLYNGIRNR